MLAGYDPDGNPAIGDDHNSDFSVPGSWAWNFSYDEMDRLVQVSGRDNASYRYDGDGRRVERVDANGTTRFLYDGDQVVEELSGANAVQVYRLPGVGFTRNGAQRYEYENALGSPIEVCDQSNTPTGLTEYDAYGREVYQDIFTDRGDFRFAGAHGAVNDDAFGWQMMGARYYLPAIGRFLTQDPIGQAGGLNLYAYCDNSPLMRVDPSGNDWQSYWHDVGQVFLGYGDVINPVNWVKGAWGIGVDLYGNTLAEAGRGQGLMSFQLAQIDTGIDTASGFWNMITDWSSPRAFGNSVGTGLMIAAPAMKAIPNPLPYGLDSYSLAQGGRTLLNVSKDGDSIFRIDYHRLPNKGYIEQSARGQMRLHYHRTIKGIRNSIDVHRPYQFVRGQSRF